MRYLLGLMFLFFLGCNAKETPTPPAGSSPSDKVPRMAGPSQERIANTSKQVMKAGIGVSLRVDKGDVFIGKVHPETPAAWSNAVQENDRIIAVAEGDDEPVNVTGLKLKSVVQLIRGPKGSVVRLTIIPGGKDETDIHVVSLTRGEVEALNRFGDGKLIPVGTKAPDFKFTRLVDGVEEELSEQANTIVVLEFWATWCGPCIQMVDKLESIAAQHPEWKGQVALLAVSVDERIEDAAKCFAEHQWKNVSIVWAGPDALKAYHGSSLPTVYVIDRNGNVAEANPRLDIPEILSPLLQPTEP